MTTADTRDEDSPSAGFSPRIWFGTPVWARHVVESDTLNPHLLSVLQSLKAEDDKGLSRSNDGGWHSGDRIHRREDMTDFAHVVGTTAAHCAAALTFDFERFELVIREMWLNENGPGASNKAHVHPGAFLSGVYYVSAPAECGNIEFHDPVAERVMAPYPVAGDTTRSGEAIEYSVKEGLMLLFPAWVRHGVQPNRSRHARVSVSFNIGFRRKP